MLESGYIKAYRALKQWGWYKDGPTKDTWLHILLSANYEPQAFKGRTVARGQLVTSYPALAEQTGLSVQNVRTAIRHLKRTGEIEMQSYRDYSVITVCKFDEYQSEQPAHSPPAGGQQADGSPLTTMEESKKPRTQEGEKGAPLPADAPFSPDLRMAVEEWLAYKRERREAYKPTGLRCLLAEIERKAACHGDQAVADVIRLSMSNNWRGIVWDRARAAAQPKPAGSFADVAGDW